MFLQDDLLAPRTGDGGARLEQSAPRTGKSNCLATNHCSLTSADSRLNHLDSLLLSTLNQLDGLALLHTAAGQAGDHLAASSQYDRSDCGIDEDEEPTSFFDNDEPPQPPRSESDFGQGDPAEGVLQTNKRKRTTVVFPDPDDGFRCSSYEDGRIGGRIDGDAWRRESAERLPAIRDSSFDSGLSWFQEHYGRVWTAEDCESDSVASSSSSCSR